MTRRRRSLVADSIVCMVFGSSGGGSIEFPGATGFSAPAVQRTVSLPSGAAPILIKGNGQTPDGGDDATPQGAIIYAKAPSSAAVETFAEVSGFDGFYLPYTVSVPAGGSAVLRFAYVQDFALSDVQSLAQQAIAGFHPTLTLSSPRVRVRVLARASSATASPTSSIAAARSAALISSWIRARPRSANSGAGPRIVAPGGSIRARSAVGALHLVRRLLTRSGDEAV